MDNYFIFCTCGCGEKNLKLTNKYIHGHNMKGKKQRSTHIKNRVKSFKSKYHKTHHWQETKNKISLYQRGRKKWQTEVDRFTRYVQARGKVAFKTGYFYSDKNQRKMFHRSSYELQAYKLLEQMDVVEKYIYEPFNIYYTMDDGKEYIYHPDLLVIYKDGSKQLLEIKPKKELDDIVNIKKFDGAKKFCLDKNLSFGIWTEDNLFKDNSLSGSIAKVANSENPKLEKSSMVTPNQAENVNSRACVESIDDPRKR